MGEKPFFYIQTHLINDWSPRDRYEESKAARCCTTGPRAPCDTRSMNSFSVPGLDNSGLTARGGEDHLDIDTQPTAVTHSHCLASVAGCLGTLEGVGYE